MKKLGYSFLTIALLFIGMQGAKAATNICEYENDNGNIRYTLAINTYHNYSTTSGRLYGAQPNAEDDPQQIEVKDWDNRVACPNNVVLTRTGSGDYITLNKMQQKPAAYMGETVLNYKKTYNNVANITGDLTCTYAGDAGKVTFTTGPNQLTTMIYEGDKVKIHEGLGNKGSISSGSVYITTNTAIKNTNFMTEGKYECPNNFYFFYGSNIIITDINHPETVYNTSYGFIKDEVDKRKEYPNLAEYYTFNLTEKNNSISALPSGTCNFESNVTGYYELTLSTYTDGNYSVSFGGTYWKNPLPIIDIPKNMSCSQIDKLYTNCTLGGACTISTTKRIGDIEMIKSGNQTTGDDLAVLDGSRYLALLGQLKVPMKQMCNYDKIAPFNLTIGKNHQTFGSIEDRFGENQLCEDATCGAQQQVNCNGNTILQSTNLEHYINVGLMNIKSYCNTIYKTYGQNNGQNKDKEMVNERMQECLDFNRFYNELVQNNLVQDLEKGCSLLSTDMIAKLKWVLNLFRIIAPLLAIGIGTVDFIKVMVAGDADKEMKNAGKKLLIRLVAAVLLLVIPTILAFLLDIFLGNQDGYDSDNPFCDIVDWKE